MTSQDALTINANFRREVVPAPFQIADGPTVTPGDYRFNLVGMSYTSSPARHVNITISVHCCEFYDGSTFQFSTGIEARPLQFLSLGFAYQRQKIRLPSGDIAINIASSNIDVFLSPDARITTQIQYDDVSDLAIVISRFRWECRPGSELFAALGHARAPIFLDSKEFNRDTSLLFRVGHTMRL